MTNAIQGKEDLTEGLDPTDAVISGVAGGISGGVGPVLGLGGKVLINAIIGFDAGITSMVAGDRRDPWELLLGTAGGGVGGGLDIDFGGSGITGAIRGVFGSDFLGTAITVVQNLLTETFSGPDVSNSISAPSISIPSIELPGSRAAGK